MKAWATRRYARCIASQVIEDGVGRGRRAEAIGANTVMHPDKLWYTLIARKILGKGSQVQRGAPASLFMC